MELAMEPKPTKAVSSRSCVKNLQTHAMCFQVFRPYAATAEMQASQGFTTQSVESHRNFRKSSLSFSSTSVAGYLYSSDLTRHVWYMCLLVMMLCPLCLNSQGCDRVYESSPSHRNGTIQSPGWPSYYSSNLRCTYHLIAAPNERVRLRFVHFEVRSVPPKCSHDYVEIITRMKNRDDDLLELPLHGRYCGSDMENIPKLLISMYNHLIVSFKSDDSKEDRGFIAEYSFIDDSPYVIGTPSPHPQCGQTINGKQLARGTIRSPTYPGMYPDNIHCHYKLMGERGQRIKLTFIDLDIFSGGEHCPFDHVKVYDGNSVSAPEIGTYCGSVRNVTIFSTSENLYIIFKTLEGRADRESYESIETPPTDQRGFLAEFTIGNDFVNLNFIYPQDGHIRGTECDQRICSVGGSEGLIRSPNFNDTYPLNTICHYYIDGLIDKQNLEKVIVSFKDFQIPTLQRSCDNGYVAVYRHGQDPIDRPDNIFCGHDTPANIESTAPRLTIVLNTTGEQAGTGFLAKYKFETNYDIPGTPATTTSECHFRYRSSSKKRGHVKSPRHPTYYPNATSCRYELFPEQNEGIRLIFESFQIDRGGYNNDERRLMGTFCGMFPPGPLISENNLKEMELIFYSDTDGIVDTGFRVSYEFIAKPPDHDCSANITTTDGGEINSPNHPLKYLTNKICDWHLISRKENAHIILSFPVLDIEANFKLQPNGLYKNEGCPQAVLEIYTSREGPPLYRICGKEAPPEQIMSEKDYIRLRFITTDDAKGLKGFTIVWTEVVPPRNYQQCSGFTCAKSGFCVAKSLVCNDRFNCGSDDNTDEDKATCDASGASGNIIHITLGVIITFVLVVLFVICFIYHKRKTRRSKRRQEIEVRYVTRNSNCNRANAGPAGEKMLKEQTEKVSIV